MSSEIERNSPKIEIFKVENYRSECGKCHLRESRFQNLMIVVALVVAKYNSWGKYNG